MPELPEQLLNSLSHVAGFNRDSFVEAHAEGRRETSVRFNPFKRRDLPFATGSAVPWCGDGVYVDERPVFTLDPLFHAGAYYVQEPGSMFLDFALRSFIDELPDPKILDLCASPGGKSTLLNSLMDSRGLLVSNEIIKNRIPALVHNLSRWGTANTIVTNNDPAAFQQTASYFDVLVVDAPCSGSGLFRKQPDAVDHWSVENVAMCSARQRTILEAALPALREGGLLFYSTCSYSEEENEQITEWLIRDKEMEYIPLPHQVDWGLTENGAGYRFFPDKTRSEGFYCALLRKKAGEDTPATRKSGAVTAPGREHAQLISEFVDTTEGEILQVRDRLHFMPSCASDFLSKFGGGFYVRKAGQYIGEIKGKDLVPSQELAWSIHLRPETGRVELDVTEALKYLKKQAFSANTGKTGLHLVTYKDLGLGWSKILAGRINNYLPNELRILMQ